jgi:hypothetical protein
MHGMPCPYLNERTAMSVPDIEPLPVELAQAADNVIDVVLNAAAREVTATGCTLVAAMDNAWTRLAVEQPDLWAMCVLRLSQTGNEKMLLYATRGRAL